MFRIRFAESLIYTVLNINVKTLLPETLLQHITPNILMLFVKNGLDVMMAFNSSPWTDPS